MPRDDDIDWTILGLHLLEKYGRELTTEQIAAEWLDRVPFTQTYTAERAAYRNLIHGVTPPETATTQQPVPRVDRCAHPRRRVRLREPR